MNLDAYKKIFQKSLSLKKNSKIEKLRYESIPEWDSIGHMSLIAALEEKCKTSFKTDDIINFSSFEKGIKILKKYNVIIK